MRALSIGLALAFIALPAWAQAQTQHACLSPGATADETIADCTALIQTGGQKPANLGMIYDNRGVSYIHKGLYDQAIADDTQAIMLMPGQIEPYRTRATAYAGKRLFDQAIADDTRAIALKPDDAISYNNRGIAYGQKGLIEPAIADFDKAVALKPDYTNAYFNRGTVYENGGRRDAAVASYRAALNINPGLQAAKDRLTALGVAP